MSETGSEDEVVDITIEISEGACYQFLRVRKEKLDAAIAKAVSDGTFSITNLHSAAIVVPWVGVVRVSYLSIYCMASGEQGWATAWEKQREGLSNEW